jgi:hypothetical protein
VTSGCPSGRHFVIAIRTKWVFALPAGLMALFATYTAEGIDVGCTPESWRDVIRTPHSDAEWVEMLRAAKNAPRPADQPDSCLNVAVAALAIHLKVLDPNNAETRFRWIVNRVGSTP